METKIECPTCKHEFDIWGLIEAKFTQLKSSLAEAREETERLRDLVFGRSAPRYMLDANHEEIKETAYKLGASVLDTSSLGGGWPDLIVGFNGENHFIEIKTAKGELTHIQKIRVAIWHGNFKIVRTPDELLAALKVE